MPTVNPFAGVSRNRWNSAAIGRQSRAWEIDQEDAPLGRLQSMLEGQAYGDPFSSLAYRSRMGTLRDVLREGADEDAGRSLALGLSPGMAIAAGAGGRSRAAAEGVRGAASDAEGRQQQQRAALLQLLGLRAGIGEQRRGRQDANAASRRQAISGFMSSLVGALIPGN